MLFGLRKNEDEIVALIKANKKNWKKISGSFVSLFFVAIGVFFLISSHAATTGVSLEAENGTLSGGATKVADSTASGGNAVAFGAQIISVPAPPPPPPPAGAPFIPYGPNSFLRTPLGSNWPVDSDSANGIAWYMAHDAADQPKFNGVDGNQWGSAFAIGKCSDPIYKFPAGTKLNSSAQNFLMSEGFHAPEGWTNNMASNNDAPIEIIDTCGVPARPNGFSVWAANVAYAGNHMLKTNPLSNSGSIVAGSFSHDTNGINKGVQHSNDTRGFNETSRGIIPDSITIRDDLLRYGMSGGNNGTLGHVLEMFSVGTNSAMGVYPPMLNAENGQSGYGAEGERIALKPTWKPPSTCTGAPLVVARTLQVYGVYIGNNSGSGSGIKVQQNSTLLHTHDLAKCFTYNDMAFVQRGWSASW
jgi:hypothetical protein